MKQGERFQKLLELAMKLIVVSLTAILHTLRRIGGNKGSPNKWSNHGDGSSDCIHSWADFRGSKGCVMAWA